MKKILTISLSALLLSFAVTNPVHAFSLTKSSKTDQTTVIFKFKGGVDLPLNLTVFGGAELMPFYSNIVGKNKLLSGTELWSTMTSVEANVGYNLNLFNAETVVGNFNPTFTPFVGYRHYFTHSGGDVSLTKLTPTTSLSNIGGINYGLRFSTNIPLGFHVFAEGGGTSLLDGAYSQENPQESSNLSGGNLFLPSLRAGASWSIFELASISVGYGLSMVPDIRNKGAVSASDNATVHSLDLGLRVLFFSI